MKTFFIKFGQMVLVLLSAVLITTVGYAKTSGGMKGDMPGETKMKVGAEIMLSADHLIMASLEKMDLAEEATISKGGAMLREGEKMIVDGKMMMGHPDTRIKGKELMMLGGTRMMKGKDFIMHELKNEKKVKPSVLKAEEHELTNSENLMLEGKNLMMDGERNFE